MKKGIEYLSYIGCKYMSIYEIQTFRHFNSLIQNLYFDFMMEIIKDGNKRKK